MKREYCSKLPLEHCNLPDHISQDTEDYLLHILHKYKYSESPWAIYCALVSTHSNIALSILHYFLIFQKSSFLIAIHVLPKGSSKSYLSTGISDLKVSSARRYCWMLSHQNWNNTQVQGSRLQAANKLVQVVFVTSLTAIRPECKISHWSTTPLLYYLHLCCTAIE